MQFDHIVIATSDPVNAAHRLSDNTGLTALEGGVHDSLGTYNYIVPLGRGYLELVGVHDDVLANRNPFGQLVLSALARNSESFAGWAVEVTFDQLTATAHRLATKIRRLTRRGVGIDYAGMETSTTSPGLPFLLTRYPGVPHPGHLDVDHDVSLLGDISLQIAESAAQLDHWIDGIGCDSALDIEVRSYGSGQGINRVCIGTSTGPIVLTAAHPIGGATT